MEGCERTYPRSVTATEPLFEELLLMLFYLKVVRYSVPPFPPAPVLFVLLFKNVKPPLSLTESSFGVKEVLYFDEDTTASRSSTTTQCP